MTRQDRTEDTSESFMQITKLQIFFYDMRDHRPVETVVMGKSSIITGFELGKV